MSHKWCMYCPLCLVISCVSPNFLQREFVGWKYVKRRLVEEVIAGLNFSEYGNSKLIISKLYLKRLPFSNCRRLGESRKECHKPILSTWKKQKGTLEMNEKKAFGRHGDRRVFLILVKSSCQTPL